MPENQSIQQLLKQCRAELHGEAETEATKQFAMDLDEVAKEYAGILANAATQPLARPRRATRVYQASTSKRRT